MILFSTYLSTNMHFRNLPCDLIRSVGLYLKLEDVTELKCTNKYTNNSLNDRFFGVYWDIHCPNNFKTYYNQRPKLIDTTNLNKCKNINTIDNANIIIELANKLLDIYKNTYFHKRYSSLTISFKDPTKYHHIICSYENDTNFGIINTVNGKNKLLFEHTALINVILDILHNQQREPDLLPFIVKKLHHVSVYIPDQLNKKIYTRKIILN